MTINDRLHDMTNQQTIVATLDPCQHKLDATQCISIFDNGDLTITIDEVTQNVFTQINKQLGIKHICPLCRTRVKKIVPENKRFPLSDSIFSRVKVSPLNVKLHEAGKTAAKVENVIHFRKVELANITNKGRDSIDDGETYQRLAELADDFNGLVSAFGGFLGRILFWTPVSWKAGVFIREMKKATEKRLNHCTWVLSDKDEKTIGSFSLSEIEKEKFDLSGELESLKLYNVGVLLHSSFQRKGVVTELTNHLYDQICRLNFDIDGLWIATRPDNVGVNHIANKLNFTMIKKMDVEQEDLIPFFSSTYIPFNLYFKRISATYTDRD
jgi:RimJ/RimL family protein N-acetyltransferase